MFWLLVILGIFGLGHFLTFGVVCLFGVLFACFGEVGFFGWFSSKLGRKLDISKSGENEICVCGKGCDGMCGFHTLSHIVLLLFFFVCLFVIVVLLNSLSIS